MAGRGLGVPGQRDSVRRCIPLRNRGLRQFVAPSGWLCTDPPEQGRKLARESRRGAGGGQGDHMSRVRSRVATGARMGRPRERPQPPGPSGAWGRLQLPTVPHRAEPRPSAPRTNGPDRTHRGRAHGGKRSKVPHALVSAQVLHPLLGRRPCEVGLRAQGSRPGGRPRRQLRAWPPLKPLDRCTSRPTPTSSPTMAPFAIHYGPSGSWTPWLQALWLRC